MSRCAIPGCTATITVQLLMCRPHWKRVPSELQRAVYEAFADRHRARDYRTARQAAIDYVVADGAAGKKKKAKA